MYAMYVRTYLFIHLSIYLIEWRQMCMAMHMCKGKMGMGMGKHMGKMGMGMCMGKMGLGICMGTMGILSMYPNFFKA